MWAVAYFKKVFQAEAELTGLVDLYVPRGSKIIKPRHKNSPVVSVYPLLGNLMFVRYDESVYEIVRSITGFKRFIKVNGEVAVCRPGEVEQVMEAEKRGDFRHESRQDSSNNRRLLLGDSVSIINRGPFEGDGIITQINQSTVKVQLSGWNYELTLSSCNVKPVDI